MKLKHAALAASTALVALAATATPAHAANSTSSREKHFVTAGNKAAWMEVDARSRFVRVVRREAAYHYSVNASVGLSRRGAGQSAWLVVTYHYIDWKGVWQKDGRVEVEPRTRTSGRSNSVRTNWVAWKDDYVNSVRFWLCYKKNNAAATDCRAAN